MLEIRLFGQFGLRAGDEPITLPSRKAQALLAYLVLSPGVHHRREKVAGMLWPESGEGEARRMLRYALWQLRNKVGEAYFLADRIHVAFNPESEFWLDVAELKRAKDSGLSTDELLLFTGAYEGELLPGFYDDWVVPERGRLESDFEQAAALTLSRLAEEERWREVLTLTERWIAVGHGSEPAFRAMMVAHSHLGDMAGAAMAYERCRETLQADLGVEPSAETRQLFEAISRGEKPGLGTPAAAGAIATPGKEAAESLPRLWLDEKREREKRSVFVARERELFELDQQLETALDGRGRVVFVLGDAGRGKSSLLGEFVRRALRRDDQLVVSLGSGEAQVGAGDPHLPFRDVLALLAGDVEFAWTRGLLPREGVSRLWDLFPTSVAALAELGPDLLDSFVPGEAVRARALAYAPTGAEWQEALISQVALRQSRPSPINIQHGDSQLALFDQYTRVLQRLAQTRPLLIVLDDMQWADIGSISLLFHLGRRLDGYRILIVGAYRPDEVAQGPDGRQHPLLKVKTEFVRNFGQVEIDLDQADPAEGRHFVDAYLDSEQNSLGEDFRRALYRHTGGHPLFTVELLRQMQLQGDLQKDEHGRWIANRELGWDALPPRVEAVIAGRINRLPEELKDILRAASVEGEEFTAEVVSSVTRSDRPAVIEALSHKLDQQHFLVEASGTRRIGRQRLSLYRFRHHLHQKYVYRSLDEVERIHLHEAVGDVLEMLYEGDLDQAAVRLARHFEEAGLTEKAADYLLRAGEIAKRQSANQEAIAHFTRGLKLLESLPADAERDQREFTLQMALAAPLVATKAYTAPEAERAYERARTLCERMGDQAQLARALWGLWSYYLVRGRHATAKGLAEQILSIARATGNSDLVLASHWTLGISLVHLGHFVEARENLDTAIETYEPDRHEQLTYLYGQNPAVTCLIYSAVALWVLGYPDRANERCQRAIRVAQDLLHPFSLAFVHSMAAVYFGIGREPEAALHHSQEAIRLAKESGFPFLLALGLTMQGWAGAALGKGPKTGVQMRRGIEGMDRVGAELGRPIFECFLAETAKRAGQIEEGLEAVGRAAGFAESNDERLNEAELHRLRGELLSSLGGNEEESVASFEKAIAVARQQNAKSMELRATVSLNKYWQARGQGGKVQRQLGEICAWFGQEVDTPDLKEARRILYPSDNSRACTT